MKRPRVIGTTEAAIVRAEQSLRFRLPPSFRRWLLKNNGRDLEGVSIYPVTDDRDIRKTWDSIVREYEVGWAATLENFADERRDFSHLLPFGHVGTGDYYCFDYSRIDPAGEAPVVWWSHETGDTSDRSSSFDDFAEKIASGLFAND